jgi:septal ring-binding cell division protein DamX
MNTRKPHDTDSTHRKSVMVGLPLFVMVIGSSSLVITGFVVGYFWGVKSSVEQLSMQLDQEAFADQISASLIPMHETQPEESPVEVRAQDEVSNADPISDEQEYVSEQSYLRTYYAQLAGFGSKRSAQKFAQKLEKQDIPVVINAVHSKNRRGKSVTWYQVVTESYSTKEELEALVERLKETEKLKDPQIVHC